MYDYESLRYSHGKKVPQTVDQPILVFDYFELSDVFIALFIILVFGVIFFSWWTMTALLLFFLGFGPYIKKRNERGIFLHWPYKNFNMSLPGLINPGKNQKFSD